MAANASCTSCGRRNSDFATLTQAAEFTCGSRSGWYDIAKRGEIELVRLGGRTLIRWAELERFAATAKPWTPPVKKSPKSK